MMLESSDGLRVFTPVSMFLGATENVALHAVGGSAEFGFCGVAFPVSMRGRAVSSLCVVSIGVLAVAPIAVALSCAAVVAVVTVVVVVLSVLAGTRIIVGILSMTGVSVAVVVLAGVPLETGCRGGNG